MPLPPPTLAREPIHQRHIECNAYRREDGLFEIEGRVVDRKTYDVTRTDGGRSVKAGDAIHDIGLRIAIDTSMVVREVSATTDHAPYAVCPEATGAMQRVVGLKIGAGWNREIKSRLGGAQGCTHLMELLAPMATTAYQALVTVRNQRPALADPNGKPVKIDSCYAYASNRDVVRVRWPAFYTGEQPPSGTTGRSNAQDS